MKKNKILFILFLAFFIFRPQVVLGKTVDLEATADSFINNGNSFINTNFGSAHSLIVSNDLYRRVSLVQFELSLLPKNAIIDSAKLKIYLYNFGGDGSVSIKVNRITEEWKENELKWENQPNIDQTNAVSTQIDSTVGYKIWTVTDLVAGFIQKKFPNYGFSLSYSDGNYQRLFRSKEFGTNPPILSLTYHLAEPSTILSVTSTSVPISEIMVTPTIESLPSEVPGVSLYPTPEIEAEKPTKNLLIYPQILLIIFAFLALIISFFSFLSYLRHPKKS